MTLHRAALALLLACASALYLEFAAIDELVSLGGDSAVYLLTAQHFAGIDPSLTSPFAQSSFYPPAYPLLLAVTGAAGHMLTANLVTTACLLIAFFALHAFARAATLGAWTALLVVAVFAAVPGSYLQTVMAQSENLYVLASLAALACGLAHGRRGTRAALAGLVAFTALAAMTRSAGVALLAALFVQAAITRNRALLLAAVVASLPAVAWRWLHPGGSGYDTQLSGSGASLAAFAMSQIETWVEVWPSNFGAAPFAVALVWTVTALGLGGAVVRALRWQLDGLYACAYLAMCLVWPFPAEAQRLLWVILPVLLVQAAWFLGAIAMRLPESAGAARQALPLLVPAGLLLAILPGLMLVIGRYRDTPPQVERLRHLPEWYVGEFGPEYFAGRDQLLLALREAGPRTPADDCVYAVKPSLVAFHSRRKSVLPPTDESDERFRRSLVQGGCHHFLMMGATPSFRFFYPFQRLEQELETLALYAVPLDDGSKRPVAMLARWRAAP